jgi:hypothetical protein
MATERSPKVSATVKAERFNAHGARIENVEVTANRVGDAVYLHIEGKGPAKSFVMAATAWGQLDVAARDTGNVTPLAGRTLAARLRAAADKPANEPLMGLLDAAAGLLEATAELMDAERSTQ